MTPQHLQMIKLLTHNFDFWGHLSTFDAENTRKNWPFRSKTMPNTFQTTLKKLRKNPQNDFFDPPKWPNLGCQFGKNCRFFGPLSTFELYFWLVRTEKKIKLVPSNSLKDLLKKEKKHDIFTQKYFVR